MDKNAYFYALLGLALAIFFAGVGANVAVWLSARGHEKRTPGPGALNAFVLDVLLQRRVLAESRLRWAMSMSLAWGFIELFFVGSLGDMFRDYGLTSGPGLDAAWFAIVNEVGGLLVLLGVAIALYRRYVVKTWQLRTGWDDGLILGWLTLIVLSGYVLESTRFLADNIASAQASHSFVGYGISRLLNHLGSSWGAVRSSLWWLHVALAFSLIAYIPYSKLFHIFTAPLSIVSGSVSKGAVHGLK